MADPVTLKSGDDYGKLPAGTSFKAPDGSIRQKPFKVTDDAGYDSVPEGAHFTDPKGAIRVKPSYDGISTEAQTLYDEAVNPKEQRNALTHVYGKDKVKTSPTGEVYVEQSPGKRLTPAKSKLIGAKGMGAVASAAAPVTMAGAGEVAGGLFGSRFGPAGAFLGSAGGAGVGSVAGQAYNDLQLALAGVYDRTPAEEMHALGEASEAGATGSVGGRVIGKAAGNLIKGAKDIPGAMSNITAKATPYIRKYLGAEGENFETATALAKKGVPVPVETWAPGAFMPKIVQKWAKQITGFDPVKQPGETYYNAMSRKIMQELGINPEEASTRITAAVSSEKAGKAALDTSRKQMAEADAELNRVHAEALRHAGVTSPDEKATSVRDLQTAIDNNEKVAQTAIDQSWRDIGATREQLMTASKTGGNPGDLARSIAGKLQAVNKAVKSRASVLYNAADAAAGGKIPNIAPLQKEAEEFLKNLPEGFDKKYPNEIKLLAKLGQKEDGQPLTFGQLHQIRSFLRHGIDWQDLTPDFRAGALKRFGYLVNNTLHDAEAAPELKAAAKMLDKTDEYYARNMGAFNDAKIQSLVDITQAGLPPNPSVIARNVMEQEGGWTERMTKLRRLMGPQNWKGVQAADLQNMTNTSKTLAPGVIDTKKFADQILKRYQTGVLENGYDKATADKLLKFAQRIAIKGGTMDFKLLPGDTVSDAVARINAAQSRIDAIVAKDPYSTLSSEVRRLEAEHGARVAEAKGARSTDPLNFLNEPSALAIASADKILSKPDLIKAAAVRFGPESQEFTLLRQVAAQRMLQRNLAQTMKLGGDFADYTRDVQKLIFPNGLDQSVIQLGKEMKALFPNGDSDFGANMSGMLLGTHPKEAVQKILHHKLIGPEFLHRIYVSQALDKASAFFSNPKVILFVANRSKPLTKAESDELAQEALKYVKFGSTGGAAAGAAKGREQAKTPKTTPKPQNWRERYKQRYDRDSE